MSMENVIPFEELERKRKKSAARRLKEKEQQALAEQEVDESSAMAVINEIFNPKLKIPKTVGHYTVPDEVHAGDVNVLKDLDEKKLLELKEVFLLFDADQDGLISRDDLRITFLALGGEAPEDMLDEMIKEAKEPLDYDAFVELMGFRTIELDPEDVLLEAWSKWDDEKTGLIEEKKIYEELTNYGDKMSTSEAKEALSRAPMAKPKTLEEPSMIDYPAFCRMLSGLRKRKT
ncbi:myosin regulatory light chain LC-2, mantle muscle [Episyrphus balteatus]|uniref:myosin regulatory light chain LC-2, mantle muscle n=1 Tax=Episyrphus balteatus TaxID=286459 RepID=UPI0024852200|nr:myosin regulatory light chain LC-2, mantle muscle [Episyrphus balteatus]